MGNEFYSVIIADYHFSNIPLNHSKINLSVRYKSMENISWLTNLLVGIFTF